ncbi:MAG: BatD family protein [Flavobacteriales bacterium]
MNRILILLLFIANLTFAQEFTAIVSKKNVEVGEEFQIIFSANGSASEFKAPNLLGLRKISGPNKSSSSSMQIINGTINSSKTTSFSYYVSALSEGVLTIPAATIKIEGKKIQSQPIKITVKKADPNKKSGFQIGDNVKVEVEVSRRNIFQGEQVLVSYKLFSKINLADISITQFPNLNGFWNEEIETNSKAKVQNIDGVNYRVWEINKSMLTPQKSGDLKIDPMKINITVQLKSQNRSGDIFGMFNNYKNVVEEIQSKQITIKVKDLPPNPPASFNGAVGVFKLRSKTDKKIADANTAINYEIELSGSGNLHLIDNIPVNFPDDFEVFDPEKKDKSFTSKNGIKGKLLFNYLIIPRYQGEYEIPSQEFSFFNLRTKKYETLKTNAINIKVNKGNYQKNVIASSKQLIDENSQSLSPIKTKSEFKLINKGEWYQQWWYILLLALPVLLTVAAGIRQTYIRIIDKNPIDKKYRKSLKIAQKRLKNAEIFLKNDKKQRFYEEIEKSLLNYFSQKFNTEIADLSKEKISEIFIERKIDKDILSNYISILEDCEYCRYSPASIENNDLNIAYNKASGIIIEIEKQLK